MSPSRSASSVTSGKYLKGPRAIALTIKEDKGKRFPESGPMYLNKKPLYFAD